MSNHPQAGSAFNQDGLKAWVVGAGRLALWTTWGREPQRGSPAGQATRPRHPRLATQHHTAKPSRQNTHPSFSPTHNPIGTNSNAIAFPISTIEATFSGSL